MQTKRIAGNTAAMFLRQIAVLGINLFMIRMLLKTLGVEDFAVYSVVYNLVLMSAFLWMSLQTITLRYFASAIGSRDEDKARAFYDATVILCLIAALLAFLGLETLGSWFVQTQMEVDPDRLAAALFLFRALIVFALLNMLSIFFASVLMAHEDMQLYALISILEAALRLGSAIALSWLAFDPLAAFGILFSGSALIVTLSYAWVAIRRYPECSLRVPRISVATMKDMMDFTGWTVFGQITTVFRIQAVTILINQAFSPTTVTARALSMSVGAQVLAFSNNFSAALNPPITKTYAAGEHQEMYSLVHFGSKIAFYLVWMATLPLIATMPGILTLWLGDYPEEAVLFTRLALIENAIVAISYPLMTAARATGQVRSYELILGSMQLMVLILSWACISFGSSAVVVYYVAIFINLAMFVARLVITGQKTGLPVGAYLKAVLIPVSLVVAVSSLLALVIIYLVPEAENLSFELPSLFAIALLFVAPVAVVMTLGLSPEQCRGLVALIGSKLGANKGR